MLKKKLDQFKVTPCSISLSTSSLLFPSFHSEELHVVLQPGHKWMYCGGNILFSSFLVVLKNGTGTFLQKNVSVAWCVALKSLSVKSKSRSY